MRPSSEALLVSAIVNTADVNAPAVHGIEPDMLVGYQAEFRWVVSYASTYKQAPSKDALKAKFPDFPLTDHTDVAFAADEVRHAHNQRMLKLAVRTASQHISEGDYDEAAMAIATYAPSAVAKPLTNTLDDMSFLDAWDDVRPAALPAPWRTLQNFTGGMRKGDVWYIAARTNKGKSWMLAHAAAQALKDGNRVFFYSLEMSEEQVRTRMHVVLGKILGIPVDHVMMRDRRFNRTEYRRLVNRIRDEIPGELLVHDTSKGRVSPATVASHAKDADLSIIDHVGLMSSPLGRRSVDDWRIIAAISNEIKEVAVGFESRVLGAVQVNREGDTPGKYPPKLKNLAGADDLARDCDVLVTAKDYSKTSRIYSIEKNRHGTAEVYFYSRFLPNTGVFDEINRDQADALRDNEKD